MMTLLELESVVILFFLAARTNGCPVENILRATARRITQDDRARDEGGEMELWALNILNRTTGKKQLLKNGRGISAIRTILCLLITIEYLMCPKDIAPLQFNLHDRKNERHLSVFCDAIWSTSQRELRIGIPNLQFVVPLEVTTSDYNQAQMVETRWSGSSLRQLFDRRSFAPETLHIQIEPVKKVPGLECTKHWPTINGYPSLANGITGDHLKSLADARVDRLSQQREPRTHPVQEVYATCSRGNFGKAAEWTWKHSSRTKHDKIKPGVVVRLETLWSVWQIPVESEAIQDLQFKMTLASTPKYSGPKLFDRACRRLEGTPQYFSVQFQ